MTKKPDYKNIVLIATRHKEHKSTYLDVVALGSEFYHKPKAVGESYNSWDGLTIPYWTTRTTCGAKYGVGIDLELAKKAKLKPCTKCYPKKGAKKP